MSNDIASEDVSGPAFVANDCRQFDRLIGANVVLQKCLTDFAPLTGLCILFARRQMIPDISRKTLAEVNIPCIQVPRDLN